MGDSYIRSASVTLPLTLAAGQYSIFVTTGGPFEFRSTDNNTTASGPVRVNYVAPPSYDLEVTSVTAPAAATDAAIVDVTWRVGNSGPDSLATSWWDAVFVAPADQPDQIVQVGRFRREGGLAAGMFYERTESVRLPSRIQGLSRVVVRADSDDEIGERNESNNSLRAAATLVSLRPRPDLQVTSLQAPTRVDAGGVIDVDWTVANLGSAATPTGGSRWKDVVYLSLDNRIDGGDIRLGVLDNGSALDAPEPGQPAPAYSSHGTFRLPRGVGGNAYVIVVADDGDAVDELPYDGNNARAVPIAIDVTTVPPPDLVVSNVAGPSDAFDGDTIRVVYTVTNRGAGPTVPAAWADAIWLTTGRDRPNAARGDILLSTVGHSGGLAVGGSYDAAVDVTLPVQRDFRGRYSLTDPELKKVRVLGGISNVLEAIGIGAMTYELNQAKGSFGCLEGRAYLPDLTITGPQSRLDLAGEIDLQASTLDFEGDFSLPRK
ncbi:MAG: hypothetical protein EBU23_16025, partial [Mycobacteriaceae bacterium]|nr:hypothetical protein [Mycobacteriaceae bacterium]